MTQIAVNKQYFFPFEGKTDCHICRQIRLTAARIERCDSKCRSFRTVGYHKIKIGTQHTEGFVNDVPISFFHHNDTLITKRFPSENTLLFTTVQGNFTDQRQTQMFQVLSSAHLAVHVFFQKDDTCRHCQSERKSNQQYVHFLRRNRCHATAGGSDDTSVVSSECL